MQLSPDEYEATDPFDFQEVLSRYSKSAMRFKGSTWDIYHAALGLIGEVGELADYLKKVKYQGHGYVQAKILYEIGDVVWYCASIFHEFGVDFGGIFTHFPYVGDVNEYAYLSPNAYYEVREGEDHFAALIRIVVCHIAPAANLAAEAAWKWGSTLPDAKYHNSWEVDTFVRLRILFHALLCFGGPLEVSMETILDMNIDKLSNRYPDQKFDPEKSINRKDLPHA